jgi:hypothetical protein
MGIGRQGAAVGVALKRRPYRFLERATPGLPTHLLVVFHSWMKSWEIGFGVGRDTLPGAAVRWNHG